MLTNPENPPQVTQYFEWVYSLFWNSNILCSLLGTQYKNQHIIRREVQGRLPTSPLPRTWGQILNSFWTVFRVGLLGVKLCYLIWDPKDKVLSSEADGQGMPNHLGHWLMPPSLWKGGIKTQHGTSAPLLSRVRGLTGLNWVLRVGQQCGAGGKSTYGTILHLTPSWDKL
jgi:hypothetical protein